MADPKVLTESTERADGKFVHSCGTTLLGARVHHSIWDGPFPCSGSGRVEVEIVPYCPTCQEKPSEHGAPIEVPWR